MCGCDENHNQTYIDALVANATGMVNNTEGIVRNEIAEVNGTRTLLINGTLENGTTADGGTEVISAALGKFSGQNVGLLALVAVITMEVFLS